MTPMHPGPRQGGSNTTPSSVAHPAFKPADADSCLICGLDVSAGIHRKRRP